MYLASQLKAIVAPWRQRATSAILSHRLRARCPSLVCHRTVVWDYGFNDIEAIEIGEGVYVGPFVEIVVYHRSPRTNVPGRLILEDGCGLGTGTNVRAAGGTIRIGANSAISQNCVLVAGNHLIRPGETYIRANWDEERTGVDIGRNVWIAANCVLLPGCVIGDNAVIAAGSVVRGTVPPGELWGGVPARKIRTI